MKSMTGYGRGSSRREGYRVTVELSSVNRKQGEIVLYLPRELESLEARLRETMNRQLARGRVIARVTLDLDDAQWARRVHLNVPLAKAYARELHRLGTELKLGESLTLDALLRVPGVVQTEERAEEEEALWPALAAAMNQALAALVRTRAREGAHLAKDLTARVATMRKALGRIRKHAPKVLERYQQNLLARVRSAGLEAVGPDDERLLKEVVCFADRSDVSEEMTRLESHFQQFNDCLASAEPVGRMLDFLAQEMNREVNTIGSKANDSQISRAVVLLKTELEKFREQVQNVE